MFWLAQYVYGSTKHFENRWPRPERRVLATSITRRGIMRHFSDLESLGRQYPRFRLSPETWTRSFSYRHHGQIHHIAIEHDAKHD